MRLLRYYSRQFEITGEMIGKLFGPRRKEAILHFEEIGLTLSVPAYLTVLNKKQLLARLKKSAGRGRKSTTSFATGDNCRTLFVARNAESYYMSGIMIPLDGRNHVEAKNEYYEFLQSQLNDLKERYHKHANVLVEEQSIDGRIGGQPFEKTEITVRVPGEKKGMDMVRRIEEAKFE